ncbi:hypothetical protein RvY_11742 [Ramazzottius varieornatus]|uniref:Uncharacterized protein n=1 Tax=Ramazzottius varieornatus TaxID=947166 RepID=A0A1D1VPU9_RAMVA|nr:hypothetical protein RvY_11742 [Ramazzottius varieornatus]
MFSCNSAGRFRAEDAVLECEVFKFSINKLVQTDKAYFGTAALFQQRLEKNNRTLESSALSLSKFCAVTVEILRCHCRNSALSLSKFCDHPGAQFMASHLTMPNS